MLLAVRTANNNFPARFSPIPVAFVVPHLSCRRRLLSWDRKPFLHRKQAVRPLGAQTTANLRRCCGGGDGKPHPLEVAVFSTSN
jgi:hypothetical protein